MDVVIWVLKGYGRYVAMVVVLGLAVALAVWLASHALRWWNKRHDRTRKP